MAAMDQAEGMLELRERVKELSCLYAVSQIIVEADLERADRLRKIVAELPRAWLHPDRALARITLDRERFETPGYDAVGPVQRAELIVDGIQRGCVEVGYPLASPDDADRLFLPDERNLLDNVARQISLYVTREESAVRRTQLESQLRHSDRLATVGQLAAGFAHEINEPLSSVLGLAQLALKTPETPPQVAEDLRGIVVASLRARDIVKSLMVFAHQAPPAKSPIDLNEIAEEVLLLLEAVSEKPRLRLVRDLAAELPLVDGDPIQIRQVLVNLTVNGMQAIADEGTVTVETRGEGGNVIMSVSDTGYGMTPDVMGRIFNPFFTTKEPGEGTGLGLAVVHGIVGAHGGSIEVKSNPGKGSRFTVRLPAAGRTDER
jgi:signal transduction histidine kinase